MFFKKIIIYMLTISMILVTSLHSPLKSYASQSVILSPTQLFWIHAYVQTYRSLYRDKVPFKRTLSYKFDVGRAESIDSNYTGNRVLVGGGSSGIITLLDTTDFMNISRIGILDMDEEMPYFIDGLLDEANSSSDLENGNSFNPQSFKGLHSDVTDIKFLTGDRYGVAILRFNSKKQDKHPLLQIGALAMIDLESFQIKSMQLTGPRPDSIALSYDNRYILVANEGFYPDNTSLASISGSVWRYELIGANISEPISMTSTDQIDIEIRNTGSGPTFEPETITSSPTEMIAAVTLQESNQVLIMDIENHTYSSVFNAGTAEHLADTLDNGQILFSDRPQMRLEPDGIQFSMDGNYLFTCNEGKSDYDDHYLQEYGGARNLTVFTLGGELIYDSEHRTEFNESLIGLYNDKTSDEHGSQLETTALGSINNTSYLAVSAERSNTLHFFDVTHINKISYLGLIPTGGKSPEGITFLPQKNAFICANEGSDSITVFEYDPE